MEINETQLMEIMTTSIASAVKPLHEEVATLKAQLNGSIEDEPDWEMFDRAARELNLIVEP